MDFSNYPLDTQSCKFRMGSIGHKRENVVYEAVFEEPLRNQRPTAFEV